MIVQDPHKEIDRRVLPYDADYDGPRRREEDKLLERLVKLEQIGQNFTGEINHLFESVKEMTERILTYERDYRDAISKLNAATDLMKYQAETMKVDLTTQIAEIKTSMTLIKTNQSKYEHIEAQAKGGWKVIAWTASAIAAIIAIIYEIQRILPK